MHRCLLHSTRRQGSATGQSGNCLAHLEHIVPCLHQRKHCRGHAARSGVGQHIWYLSSGHVGQDTSANADIFSDGTSLSKQDSLQELKLCRSALRYILPAHIRAGCQR